MAAYGRNIEQKSEGIHLDHIAYKKDTKLIKIVGK